MEPGRVAAGSLGPRLAGRLTAELILRSPQYMNCVKEYEIDLRGVTATITAQSQCQSVNHSPPSRKGGSIPDAAQMWC